MKVLYSYPKRNRPIPIFKICTGRKLRFLKLQNTPKRTRARKKFFSISIVPPYSVRIYNYNGNYF